VPGLRLFQQIHAAQERTLAGATWPKDDHVFALTYPHINILEHMMVAKIFVQPFNA
jgi:hypothetical protein